MSANAAHGACDAGYMPIRINVVAGRRDVFGVLQLQLPTQITEFMMLAIFLYTSYTYSIRMGWNTYRISIRKQFHTYRNITQVQEMILFMWYYQLHHLLLCTVAPLTSAADKARG